MTESDRADLWKGAKIAACVVAIWAVFSTGVYCAITTGWEERGQFGDMFGAVNALFSGLAFAGVIYAILLQREELRLQRQELELTRAELAKAAEAQSRTVKLMEKQVRLQRLGLAASTIPIFRLHGSIERDSSRVIFKMRNSGNAPVKELKVSIWPGDTSRATEQCELSVAPDSVLKPNEDATVFFKPAMVKPDEVKQLRFILSCLDVNNRPHQQKFELLNGTIHRRY